MNKKLKKLLTIACSFVMAISVVGCSENKVPGDQTKPGGDTDKPGNKITSTINFYTTVNIIEQSALEAVASAYSDMQYDKGNDITVIINNNTDPDAYKQTIRNLVSTNGVKNPTLAMTSVIPEYYGTNKIVNLAGYLEEPNNYIEGNNVWSDALEKDAYRTQLVGASSTIPNMSYSSCYMTAFYNKSAMKDVMGTDEVVGDDGTLDASKITWDWMIGALDKAKNSGKNFKNPLAVSKSTQSCGEDSFNMISCLMNMYLDQYYRDFIKDVHSQDGDYSYINAIDSNWLYDENNLNLDYAGNYTFNINKVVDNFFNKAGYNPTSERYQEVMSNLYKLLQYADPEASYNDVFSRFNETTIVYEKMGGAYTDMKLFYIETLGYVRTYRDAFKTTNGNQTIYPTSQEINKQLGWFLLPAMNSNLEGVAKNVRPVGGPSENYGVLSTGKQSDDEIAIDFMRYLYSPQGQQAIFSKYKGENLAPIVMRQLVKDVKVPTEIDYTNIINTSGDCSGNPYLFFGKGSGMSTLKIGSSGVYIKDKLAKEFSNYFKGSNAQWSTYGTSVFDIIKSGFSNYAEFKSFTYNDYAQVASKTNGLKNSPYNTVS